MISRVCTKNFALRETPISLAQKPSRKGTTGTFFEATLPPLRGELFLLTNFVSAGFVVVGVVDAFHEHFTVVDLVGEGHFNEAPYFRAIGCTLFHGI